MEISEWVKHVESMKVHRTSSTHIKTADKTMSRNKADSDGPSCIILIIIIIIIIIIITIIIIIIIITTTFTTTTTTTTTTVHPFHGLFSRPG